MKTRKHPLLLYQLISQRMRNKLLLFVILFLVAGLIDLLVLPVLGDLWYFVWIGFGGALLLWFYYAVLMKRAAIKVQPDLLVVQGPLTRLKISYGRIYSATSVRLEMHHSFKSLSGWQKGAFRPLYQETCVLIDLEGWPKAAGWQKNLLAKQLFSSTGPGIICCVPDWIALNQDIEVARGNWITRREARAKGDTRSLAAKVMSLKE